MKRISLFALTALLAVVFSVSVSAADQEKKSEMKPETIVMMVAKTAADHQAKADYYKKKAAEYRAEADMHRAMLAEYKKNSYQPKSSLEAGDIKKMRLHCEKFIHSADAMARDAEELAKYHTLRARELRGE
jgi:polysaccharide pyruvyl transferase WcaK-like protein